MTEKKAKRGRPKLAEKKMPKQFRINKFVFRFLHLCLRKGVYPSHDAVVEHWATHAAQCEDFVPGRPEPVTTKGESNAEI